MKLHMPVIVYLLIGALIVLGISGLAGGISLLIKPDGSLLKLPLSWLRFSPFKNFLIPGIILFTLLGSIPLFTAWALLTQPEYIWTESINIYPQSYWAATYATYLGIAVMVFIQAELLMSRQYDPLQTVFATLGLLIVIFSISPATQHYFKKTRIE